MTLHQPDAGHSSAHLDSALSAGLHHVGVDPDRIATLLNDLAGIVPSTLGMSITRHPRQVPDAALVVHLVTRDLEPEQVISALSLTTPDLSPQAEAAAVTFYSSRPAAFTDLAAALVETCGVRPDDLDLEVCRTGLRRAPRWSGASPDCTRGGGRWGGSDYDRARHVPGDGRSSSVSGASGSVAGQVPGPLVESLVTAKTTDEQPLLRPVLTPLMSFSEASERVLDHLQALIPMSFWSVTAYDARSGGQTYLHLRDEHGRRSVGSTSAWSESFCRHMVTGEAPQIAPDAMAVAQYASISAAAGLDIGAYIGVPISTGDGQLFGTLCGTDPHRQPDGVLEQHAPLLELLATLLEQILAREQVQAEAEGRETDLRWRAFHDELTGLPNRALFNDRLDHALALHKRDHRPLALLTLDIDDFKAVNDTFGHAGGDELLVQLAGRLRSAVRTGDTLARLGGDEFAVLLEHSGDTEAAPSAEQFAARILAALTEPFLIEERRLDVGISVGVASLGSEASPSAAEALLNHADVALYSAKRDGKFRATVYHPQMQLPEARDLQLREPLREAIENGDIQDFYQPVVALNPLAVVKVECLARWNHQGTPVSPEVFIPLAARSRLLPALTALMVARACAQLSHWCQTLGHDQFGVAVNMPPSLLTDRTFPSRIAAQVARAGLHPRQLTLEITEDALLGDFTTARRVAEELHEQGFRLALDDFGTGYSSLLHLRSIPLNVVKIDRGFTSDVDTNPQTRRFMQTLITMGHDLGLRVIVEGVERESQADVLLSLGATHAQGYFYARPAPAHQVDLSTVVRR